VPRDEHREHWRQTEREYDFLRERVTRDDGKMEKRLDRLEERLCAKP
jgi:hypothetical protein